MGAAQHGTPGGERLRALREYVRKTQLETELDANLGIGYLQRVESGKVGQPERDTLERILTALGARYTDRRDILELFGYVVNTPLPDAADIAWAAGLCQTELKDAVFPAYLLDCAHRVLACNLFFTKVFGREADSLSMLRLLYDPSFGVTQRIANPEVFFAAQIRALRYEMRWFQREAWCQTLLDDLLKTCPLFARYWTATADEAPYPVAARPLFPLQLRLPTMPDITLQFRLTSEPFAQDRRFRVIYYLPADAVTMQQCVQWLSGDS